MSIAHAANKINPSSNVVRLPLTVGAAVIAVRKLRGLTVAEKGVLYTIAAHMPDCYPSVGLLVEETGASRPQVFKLLARLEARGIVRRTRRGGRYGTNSYELVFQPAQPAERSPGETQGSLLETSEGSLLETQGDKDLLGVKKERERRAGGADGREAHPRRSPAAGPAPESSRRPTHPESTILPSGSAPEPPIEEGGDRGIDPSRYELPDVSVQEPERVDREVAALRRRHERGERLYSEPEHLVACFDAAHRYVYDFPSLELRGPKLWKCAVSAATRVANAHFAGDVEETARYVEWVWARERAAQRAGRYRDRPIGWCLVFGPMVGDYLKVLRDRARRAA